MEPLEVKICMNTQCMMKGAMDIMDQIESLNDIVGDRNLTRGINIEAVPELEGSSDPDMCPVVQIGDLVVKQATTENVMSVILDATEGGLYK